MTCTCGRPAYSPASLCALALWTGMGVAAYVTVEGLTMANVMFHFFLAEWAAIAAATILPVIALVAGYFCGTRGASVGGLAGGVVLAGVTELALLLVWFV